MKVNYALILLSNFLISFSSTSIVNSISNSYHFDEFDNLNLSLDYKFDIGYSTLYENGIIDDYWQQEVYGFRLWSNLTTSVSLEILQFYSLEIDIQFILFDIAPYKQVIAWVRPEYLIDGEDSNFDFSL